MPDFLKGKRPIFIGGGDKIHVNSNIDYLRIQNSKSKKAKGVYDLMKTFKSGTATEAYQ